MPGLRIMLGRGCPPGARGRGSIMRKAYAMWRSESKFAVECERVVLIHSHHARANLLFFACKPSLGRRVDSDGQKSCEEICEEICEEVCKEVCEKVGEEVAPQIGGQ